MKQITNQRLVYKLNSSYLQRNKWNIKINDIAFAIKNRFIVKVGDSTGFNIIRQITNTSNVKSNEEIDSVKDKLKKYKKLSKISTEAKKEVKELNNKFYELSVEEHICNIVFSSDKQYDHACNNGFYINNIKYTLLIGTTGGIKNNTAMFCDEKIYNELMTRIYNGFDIKTPMIPSKLMGYMSLIFSSSTPVTNTCNILVVKDVETKFNETVTHIEFNDKIGEAEVKDIKDKEIIVNACDGCGLITPELAEIWSEDLQLDYTPSSFCIRNSFLKGMLTRFNFKSYVKNKIGKKYVEDVWGNTHDINNIDMILNQSMLKCWMGYKDINDYIDNCNKNGYTFSVTKTTPKELENERTLNYQYLQCLDLTDEDIDKLLNKDINKIKDVLGEDYRKTILFTKGLALNNDNVWNNKTSDDFFAKALMINKNVINDDYIKYRIRNLISKKMDMLKTGKINVEGNYQISIGEPVLQLESMFGLEPKGLLKSGEFYIKYWRDRHIKKVGAFRSPMSCKSNARIMNISYNKEVEEWYGDLNGVIIFNGWDTTMMAMNGQDMDGDLDFTTCNEIILNGIFKELAIDCEGKRGEKKTNISKDIFKECIKKSFGNKVGSVTNTGSSIYDMLSLFDKDSEEYIELDRRIKCIQYYQQECIDSAKNGEPPKPIPQHWYDYRCEYIKIENTDDKETKKGKLFQQSIMAEKKPYYFIYIYKDTMLEYKNFIKKTNISCMRRFRCSVEELKAKEYRTNEENEFLIWYEKKNPVSCNPCIVNKIAWKVESKFDGFKYKKNKEFNHSIYKSPNTNEIGTKEEIKEIIKLFNEYKNAKNNQCKLSFKKDDILIERETRDETLKLAMSEIIPNEQILLNTLIHLSYDKSILAKWITWLVSGDIIIKNMLKNYNNKISYPIKDDNGDFEYCGLKFSMIEKIIEE